MELLRLKKIIGKERDVNEVARTLKHIAQDLRPATVGAMLQTCSDETEFECARAFQNIFAGFLLPDLKFAHRAPFRIANLGSRYEWGAAGLVDDHFTTEQSGHPYKLIVLKINTHVAKSTSLTYGEMERYRSVSHSCGALAALLEGKHGPSLEPLYETFGAEGKDRLALIREQVAPELQLLAAAIVNARLQARSAFIDVQSLTPSCPTLFLVVPSVTINIPDRDTEVVVGYYVADRRDELQDIYHGLGDDATQYQFHHDNYRVLSVSDPGLGEMREARRHDRVIRKEWHKQKPEAPQAIKDAMGKHHTAALAKPLLKTAVLGLASAAGAPAALLLFSEGLVGLNHVWRAHELARNPGNEHHAKVLLNDFEKRIDHLPPERAQAVLENLARDYGGEISFGDGESAPQ